MKIQWINNKIVMKMKMIKKIKFKKMMMDFRMLIKEKKIKEIMMI
jgi:hypothetical protein